MKFKYLFLIFFIVSSSISAQEGTLPVSVKKGLDTLNSAKENMLPADSILQGNYTTENPDSQKTFSKDFQTKYN